MVNWLKYFFGGFFLHKLSLESERRNFLNAVLALALSFALFLTGLYAGYVASFPRHLNNSTQFSDTVRQTFGAGELQLVVKDGIATSVGNARPVDTFSGIGVSPDTGMQVAIDTNPTARNYAEFEVECVSQKDSKKKISYEQYLELKKEEQSEYSFSVVNKGVPLVFDPQKIDGYNQHLQEANDKQNPFYDIGIAADYSVLSTDDPDYESKLYELYVASYYPFISDFERFAKAPSMKTYYTQQIAKTDYYFVILDDMCFGRFSADNGVAVDFSGFFANIGNCVLGGGKTDEQLLSGVGKLVNDAFSAGKSNVMSVYVLNAISSFPIVVVAAFVVALAMWFAIKKCHGYFGFWACVKTAFLYFFVASAVVFVLSLGLSFALPRESVYTAAVVGLFVIVLVRSAVFCVTECVASLRDYRVEQQAVLSEKSDIPIE
ncbi:MAG: hypothetical protein NC132_03565 [Corallococcus sp.]|nr:hypothetical protein [Corallococcus sp.]MCM1359579.1 hypothetical protein [Corallococcus sp.]MCM1395171.1 hypothetical protein [Corallococcus sp.]